MPRLKDESKITDLHQAARRLLIRTGYAGLKMADVAKEAGVATGTVYTYFTNKEELINQVFTATKKEVAGVLLDPANVGPTFFESFRRMWFAYFTFCFTQPEKMLFVEQLLHSGLLAEASITQMDQDFEPLDAFIRQGQQEAILRSVNVEIIKAQLMGPIHEIVKYSLQRQMNLEQGTLNQCFDMAWNSVRR